MEKNQLLASGAAFVFLRGLVWLEESLIRLAKKHLPRGSRARRWVLWSRADED